jgi:hypothetical protein
MFAHQMDHYAQQAAALWLAQAMAATLMVSLNLCLTVLMTDLLAA